MATFTATSSRAILFAEVQRLSAIEAELGREREEHRLTASKLAFYTATPATPVAAAKPACQCIKCSGTGQYGDDGSMCYACAGKGVQDEADRRRNWGYAKFRSAGAARPAPAAQPVERKPTAQAASRADAVKAFFAANPGARSVSPAQLEEFSHAQA